MVAMDFIKQTGDVPMMRGKFQSLLRWFESQRHCAGLLHDTSHRHVEHLNTHINCHANLHRLLPFSMNLHSGTAVLAKGTRPVLSRIFGGWELFWTSGL